MVIPLILLIAFVVSIEVAFIAKDKFKDKGLLAALSLSFYIAVRLFHDILTVLRPDSTPADWFIGGVLAIIIVVNYRKRHYKPGMFEVYLDVILSKLPMRTNTRAVNQAFAKMDAARPVAKPIMKQEFEEIDNEEYDELATQPALN